MPPLDKIFQDVQLNIDFAKEIDGASKLADAVLYSNLIPSETASSGANTNNIAVSFAKLYTWAHDIFTFDPTGTKKIEVKSSVLPSGIGNTYSFQEGSIVGAFQVKENQGSWQTIAIHNGLHAGDSTTNPTQAANVRLTKGSVSGDLDDTVELQWNNGSSWAKISSVTLGLLDSNNKILERYLPSYVDDVIEAYYDNGEFYSDPTTHTSATQLPHERGKIYVDIPTSISYRWGGSSYISIVNPIDVFTGATSTTAGVAGIVPAPAAGDQAKFLRGDATWQTITIPTVNNGKLTIKGGTTSVTEFTANQSGDISFSIVAGTNISVTPDASNHKVTIAATDTNTTYELSGTTYGTNDISQIVTLTPSSGTATTATISAMTGADGTNAGKAGLVPKPSATDNTKFLTGAGTWATPTNTTYALSGAYGSGSKTWVTTLTADGSTAAGTSTVPTASTSVYGITKLSSATNSTSTALAATPSAVKAAYDLADGKSTVSVSNLKLSGTKIATITIDGTPNDVYVEDMTTATSGAAGTRGTVQAPANSMDKYLRGDATWVEPVEDFRTKVNNETFTLVLHCTNGRTSS